MGTRPVDTPTDEELLAFCDEVLPPEEMARIERLLRESVPLQQRLQRLCEQRDRGLHTVGSIWRSNQLSCPDRDELGAYLLHALSEQAADYIRFHIEVVGCRYCAAELEDLKRSQTEADDRVRRRRERCYQSSIRYIPGRISG